MTALTQLGDISTEEFLLSYWQKQSLLIRQAFPNFQALLEQNEIAGLALEDSVESRLIIENNKSGPWQLKRGPFSEKELTSLPTSGWSLLVQGVNTLIPEFSQLLKKFEFIPSWRIDDIMVSIAPDGGSVGPHFDYYDVFLLQASGKRLWKVGQHCDENTPRLSGTPLRILANFETQHEWLLEPGDMLYLPPKIAHWGIAEGDCMTYSIGFRAPKLSEMLSDFCDYFLEHNTNEMYFTDPNRLNQQHPAQISQQDIDKLAKILSDALTNQKMIADWFGRFVTRESTELDESPKKKPKPSSLQQETNYFFASADRRAFFQNHSDVTLFVNGVAHRSSIDLAALLCEQEEINGSTLLNACTNEQDKLLVESLINNGTLVCEN